MLCSWLGEWPRVYLGREEKQVCPLPRYAVDYFLRYHHHNRRRPWLDTGYRYSLRLDSLGDIVYSVGSPNGESLSGKDIQVAMGRRLG